MNETYNDLVRKVTEINRLFFLQEENLLDILFRTKPILFHGHFELLSRLHSDTFFRFSLIAQYPHLLSKISQEMIAWVEHSGIGKVDVVLSTSRAGMLLAYDIAKHLNKKEKTRAAYAKCSFETGYPVKELMNGFSIHRKEKVLVVNDLSTTGTAAQILIDLAESCHGQVVGVCLFASRGREFSKKIKTITNRYRFHNMVTIKTNHWPKKKCPLCANGEKYVSGRDINSALLEKPIADVLKPLKHLRIA